jgi:catechol 2,3-dioxygenase-like lactoylglutathione lyase family enzyme
MIPAREVRFCFVVDDYEAAAHLYRDVFGLDVVEEFDEGPGRGLILKVPDATMELVDNDHGGMVDEVEVGHRVEDRVRIAVKVDDLAEANRALAGTGATAMAAPVVTPWGDHNQRFRAKDGLQLTLFQSP